MGQLTLKNIKKNYGNNTVVKGVSLEVAEGELLTVVGPSGCGKTTILRMISGLTEPTDGVIMVDGEVLADPASGKRSVDPECRDFGMVFQSYAVWPHMNVFDNVAYPLKLRKTAKNELAQAVTDALKLVHLEDYAKYMVFELSGGQQQRVALARALVMRPRLLLLDEPLSNLDAALREEMRSEIKEIQRTLGITIINVTHDQIEAMTMSDKVAVMKSGVLVQHDTPYNLYEHPVNTFVAKFIGSANILPATRTANTLPDDDGMMEVKVCGVYPCRVPFVQSDKAKGFVSVRAHHVVSGSGSPLKGMVSRHLYQGNQIEYYLEVEGADTLVRMLTDVGFDVSVDEQVSIDITKAVWLDE